MKNYKILFEDSDLLVIYKPAGLAVQSAKVSVPDLMSKLRNHYIELGEQKPQLKLINRLDQPVEGILLVGKNQQTAAKLCGQGEHSAYMEKHYQALVSGKLFPQEGRLLDYLVHDRQKNISRVVRQNVADAKRCELKYRVLEEKECGQLLEILLLTGRHHQIRVQLAHAGAPIMGDSKYGGEGNPVYPQLCLCAYKLSFLHPKTEKRMEFEVKPSFISDGR